MSNPNMPLIVVPHDPLWMQRFNDESRLLIAALGKNALASHHIGSTAIPATVAKPIIDILLVVADITDVDVHSIEIEKLGYEAKGEFGIPSRRYFRKSDRTGTRTHHVHIFASGSEHIARHIAFRDFLNSHPAWADQYSKLKLHLVSKHSNSAEWYIGGKNDFIQHVVQLALVWQLTRA